MKRKLYKWVGKGFIFLFYFKWVVRDILGECVIVRIVFFRCFFMFRVFFMIKLNLWIRMVIVVVIIVVLRIVSG